MKKGCVSVPEGGCVVAIGIFDGVHIGHKAIIERSVKRARALKCKSIALTFYPHPLKTLSPKCAPLLVSSLAHRLSLIKGLGINELMVIHFTKIFSRMTPDRFAKRVLADRLKAREIFVGENFRFGRGRCGNVQTLLRCGKRYGFKTNIVKSRKKQGVVISSSVIRSLITKGAIKEAERFLGRPVSILGSVVKGSSRGRHLGYPTANVNPHHEAIPPSGIYAVRVKLPKDKTYGGMLYIGRCPTFKDLAHLKDPRIEVHIFNFRGSIYGKGIEINFVKKIRDDRRFKSKEALKRQIARDELLAKYLLYKKD